MKTFIVLVICCSFISSRANPLPLEFSNCDDPDVFKAVDTALKKYNGERATGNQFALYMVMEAKRTAGPEPQFYVKYRIKETICAVEENKLWQDCDYKVPADASTGECTARVHMNNAEQISNVSQNCNIFPATPNIRIAAGACLGCFEPIASNSSDVSEIVKQAIQKYNKHSNESALFKLVGIKEAKRQVVAGWNYKINFEVEETNCSKDEFPDLTPECKTTSRGRVGKCETKAYQNLHAEIVDINSQCKLPVEDTIDRCYGCPTNIANNHPSLKNLLKASVEKYNSESSDEFYFKAGEIEAATVQTVAGHIYHLSFSIWKTNCSKTEFEKLNEYCEATSDSVQLSCEAQILVTLEDEIFPQVNCSKEQSKSVLLRMPPGFTPFRSTASIERSVKKEERQSPGKETREDGGQESAREGEPEHKHRHKHKHRHGHKKNHESSKRHRHDVSCGHRNEHGCGHKKHSKNDKRKHLNPKSSEESSERGFNQNETLPSFSAETASGLVNPGDARKATSTHVEPLTLPDTFLFNGLPGHPESTLPRCPGKPWKQNEDFPSPSSFPREFRDEDLLPFTVENIDPATEDSTPSGNKDFLLSDATQ